jgi:uncharacterized protein (TIGR00730 family)
MMMRSLCVFCGANSGFLPEYAKSGRALGRLLAERSIRLVYGGGSVGMMGIVADAVLEHGGEVIGVIPDFLATKELLHAGVKDMRVVQTMHDRKSLMAELADGFAALPGGLGTFEELFEVLTWTQLGLYRKPIGFLNVQGFFDPLIGLIDHAREAGFCRPEHLRLFCTAETPPDLLTRMANHELPAVPKWFTNEQI